MYVFVARNTVFSRKALRSSLLQHALQFNDSKWMYFNLYFIVTSYDYLCCLKLNNLINLY